MVCFLIFNWIIWNIIFEIEMRKIEDYLLLRVGLHWQRSGSAFCNATAVVVSSLKRSPSERVLSIILVDKRNALFKKPQFPFRTIPDEVSFMSNITQYASNLNTLMLI